MRMNGKTFVQMRFKAGLMLAVLGLSTASLLAEDGVDRVNVLIGTGSGKIGYGGTMPFVTTPFGMTNWTAQTRQNKLGVVSYKYEDPAITGFMGTHQPAIWMGDYGYVTLMPEVGALKTTPEERKLAYNTQRRDSATRLLLSDDGCRQRQKDQNRDDGDRAMRLFKIHLPCRQRF